MPRDDIANSGRWHLGSRPPIGGSEPVRPRPAADLRPSEVLERLRTSRRTLLEYVDATGEERFSRIVLPRVILGRFTGLAWLRFIARHEARHLKQIRHVLAGR